MGDGARNVKRETRPRRQVGGGAPNVKWGTVPEMSSGGQCPQCQAGDKREKTDPEDLSFHDVSRVVLLVFIPELSLLLDCPPAKAASGLEPVVAISRGCSHELQRAAAKPLT